MKVLVLFSALVALSSTVAEDKRTSFFYTNENGETWLEDLTQKSNITASINDVKLYYYSQKNLKTPYTFKCNDVSGIKNTPFSASKLTVFIVHGWQNSANSEMATSVRDAFLRSHDVNVFVVDWSSIAGQSYSNAVQAVEDIGGFVGQFAKLLENSYELKLSNVKVVGHSLGAHIAGCVGSALSGKASVITGLDPAGPGFSEGNIKNRLDKSDAQFVEAIHTNAGTLGVTYSVGNADYWPNGGSSQPGCNRDQYGSCSHGRSYMYYAESIDSSKFVAKQCSDYSSYTSGSCNNHASSSLGMYTENTKANGNYYLTTNSASPYARG